MVSIELTGDIIALARMCNVIIIEVFLNTEILNLRILFIINITFHFKINNYFLWEFLVNSDF